jgi:hypothetical protein
MIMEKQGLTDPTLSFNLSGLRDWSTAMPLIDLMKMARPFFASERGSLRADLGYGALR